MRQLVQQLGSGRMSVEEVPFPRVEPGMVLVRNHYSLISSGTEGSTVAAARKSLIGKAKERPQQVKQVVETLQKQGPVPTYRAVMKKLSAYSPLGYSSAGEIIGVGDGVRAFSVGQFVACAGLGYANHAEVVSVPVNLCAKVPPEGSLKDASYNTLGAIALQGVRQADLKLGECGVVIGLGLIGHLTCLMLRMSGVKVLAIDLDDTNVNLAKVHCADFAFNRNAPALSDRIFDITGGLGADGVIITAGSSSLDPINLAGKLCRKKGRVVVVGAVPTGFDRDQYYRKELEIRMSCSYGPGRYDPDYEEKGQDYPPAYVRWSENRNMQAFQEMVHTKKIDLKWLTTHEFLLQDAPKAYDMILERNVPFIGILIKYDATRELLDGPILLKPALPVRPIVLGFIGAGSYAQSSLLPYIPDGKSEIIRKGVMTASGTTSKKVAEKFNFEFCTNNESDLIDNKEINTLFIVTRHDSHFKYLFQALQADKNVFVEKPVCLTEFDLQKLERFFSPSKKDRRPKVMVGFNRRFAPLGMMLKERIGTGPMSMLYRVNAGSIPADSWIHDPKIGGGRIIGEVCHFVDFLSFMCSSLPNRVYASSISDPLNLKDVININLEFENGSIGTISYFANGANTVAKEYVEIHRGGMTGILKDFKSIEIHNAGRVLRKKLLNQDKGQAMMIRSFLSSVKDGSPAPISIGEICAITRATFRTNESLQTKKSLKV